MEKDKWVACCLLSLPLCFWLTVCLIESSLKRFYCDVAVLSQSGAENLGRQLSFTSGVQLCSKDWAILTNSSLHPKGGQRAKWFNQYWALCSPPLRAVQPCWASSTRWWGERSFINIVEESIFNLSVVLQSYCYFILLLMAEKWMVKVIFSACHLLKCT